MGSSPTSASIMLSYRKEQRIAIYDTDFGKVQLLITQFVPYVESRIVSAWAINWIKVE